MGMLLKLPISISNWIIIDDALQHGTTDRRLYIKAFHDYGAILPNFQSLRTLYGSTCSFVRI